MKRSTILLTVFSLFLLFMASSALAAGDVCLLEGRGNKETGMKNCVYEDETATTPYSNQFLMENGGWLRANSDGSVFFQSTRLRVEDVSTADVLTSGDKNRFVFDFSLGGELPPVGYVGVRINSLASGEKSYTPIDAHGICRYVDNHSGRDLFVPLKTHKEWLAFTQNPPSGVELYKCALPCNGTCSQHGLFYGFTSAEMDPQGIPDWGLDEGSRHEYYTPIMPYARVEDEVHGTEWPTADGSKESLDRHVFKYGCLNRVSKPHCFDATQQYCDVTDKSGITYQVECCLNQGSVCEDTEKEWTEVWQLRGIRAKASQDILSEEDYQSYIKGEITRDNGWEWDNSGVSSSSVQIAGGSRPECGGHALSFVATTNGGKCTATAAGKKGGSTGSTPTIPYTPCGW
jgi:hypothetical protein